MLRKSWIAGTIAVACAIGIVFANDGLLERLEAMFGEQSSPHPTVIQASGTIEVAFSPNNGVTQTVVKAISEAIERTLISYNSLGSSNGIAIHSDFDKCKEYYVSILMDRELT